MYISENNGLKYFVWKKKIKRGSVSMFVHIQKVEQDIKDDGEVEKKNYYRKSE